MKPAQRIAAAAGTLSDARERLELLPGGQGLPRAAEWLLDNGYVVQAALRQVKEDLPEGFWRILPRNAAGEVEVARLARRAREEQAGPIEPERLRQFVEAAQEERALTCGEIWAFPAMLRLEVLEDLARASVEIRSDGSEGTETGDGIEPLADRVASAVLGLRALAVTDWKDFFESVSRVERELRRDPAGAYARMDFATRDRYRKALEELARGSGRAETEVAAEVVRRSQAGARERERHVGYHLLDAGRASLERDLGYRLPVREWAGRWVRRHPGLTYVGSIALTTLGALVPPLAVAQWAGVGQGWMLALAGLALIPAVTLAVSLVNSVLTLSLPPAVLPKMGFEGDLPDEARTLIAVPSMLTGADEVETLLGGLEITFLANPGKNLGFALLTDFADAPQREMPGDAELLQVAEEGVRSLEARHGGGDGEPPRFFLLHRERRWNPVQGVWMGWERKRGKLTELNHLLAGAEDTGYVTGIERLRSFGKVCFVLTLDADTHLPRGAAVRLAATLAHPLNRAELAADGRVVAGYTVLQPRVEITPDSAGRTRHARLFAGESGLDLYSRAVSDVYQDLFGRGIYAGKGIYDPVAFEAGLAGRVPENALLSHDLFEGLHGRAALVSDVTLLEDFPPHLLISMPRLHRWIRGDWQLLPWLLPRVPAEGGGWRPNTLPWIGRWMILDNLRRSLFLPSLLLLLAAAWTVLPGPAWAWTVGLAAALALPIFLGGFDAAWRLMVGGAWQPILVNAAWSFRGNVARTATVLVFLPSEVVVTLDAILRTLWRLAFTRRDLLEWTTAAQSARRLGENPGPERFWRGLAAGPVLAAALAVLIALVAPERLMAALPLLLAWMAAPQLAAWMSRPSPVPASELSAADHAKLRRLARRTWHFYETFVGPEDHWLPPDNFQEDPGGVIAHRTSPTNIGMLLLSTVSAWDLGYLGADGLAARLRSTFETLTRLGGAKGHLWNWYDTRTLAPLEPRYVSTVDSGNLAGALLAVAQGCKEAASLLPQPNPALRAGLSDTVAVLAEVAGALAGEGGRRVAADLGRLREHVERGAEGGWPALLADLEATWLPQAEERIVFLVEHSRPPLDAAAVSELRTWTERLRRQVTLLRRAIGRTPEEAELLRLDLLDLAAQAEERALGMDFSFLYDQDRKIFRIGFNASADVADPNHYDLLASEARLASLIALAKGDVPPAHWLHLGRPFVRAAGSVTLLSWSGTMFEYLMPTLLAATPERTPLAGSCRAAVARQREFAREHGIPWGISESCWSETDPHRTYRYQAFGVPGLGLKRDLGERLVVAPYASLLALPFDPVAVSRNLDHLLELDALGRYGLFEALDFGPTAASAGSGPRRPAMVRCYMAHHQGMILVALDNFLCAGAQVRRFHADPRIATVEMLLHEQIPRYLPLRESPARKLAREEALAPRRSESVAVNVWRAATAPDTPPQAHVLCNGRYSVLISSDGGGSSRWKGRVLVRGEADPTLEPRGTWIWVEDLDTGEVWTAVGGPRPPGEPGEVWFAPHMAELTGRHADLAVRVGVVVAPDEDLEARLVRVSNLSDRPRRLALTSYGEVVLARPAEDRRHPAFGKLFIESGWLPDAGALVFQRRLRSPEEETVVLAHVAVPALDDPAAAEWETDRTRFLGRVGGYDHPEGLSSIGSPAGRLTGTDGSLDPIFALRRRIDLGPREEGEIAFLTAAGDTRAAALEALQRRGALPQVRALFEQARLHAGPELQAAGVPGGDARHLQELLSAILQSRPELRAESSVLAANRRGQSGLWAHGISGDRPILLVRAHRPEDLLLLREVLAAHAYWRRRRIEIDLVLLDEGATVYDQPLRAGLEREIVNSGGAEWRDRPGGIFVVRAALLDPADRTLLEAVAGAVLDAERGGLAAQLQLLHGGAHGPGRLPAFVPIPSMPLAAEATPPLERPAGLLFDNGLGGFTPDGREYVIHLLPGQATPAPWVNVVANPEFGFLASESGGGYTWAGNSSERRLTPWRNDPVADVPGESLYLRDEETGEIWTITRLPAGEAEVCQARHGIGSTVFRQNSRGLAQELRLSVAPSEPVKIAALRLTNLWQRPRRITATWYAEWVLGATRRATAPHVVSEYDSESGALLARCSFPEGEERTAFLASDRPIHGVTADRAEFLGRPADRVRPAGLVRIGLGNAVGPGLDPCAALQIHFDLLPGETVEAVFLLGQGEDRAAALDLVHRFRDSAALVAARQASEGFWDDLLGQVQVRTPEPGIDLFANRWLLGQALACRVWGRTGLYQSSGAFGFRDQLQDVMALLAGAPEIARAHILEAARHQFAEGDVLHWWHPPAGKGVRTRCSDDLLWLPYVTARYVAVTGDRSILGEVVPFRGGPELGPGHAERYDQYPLLPGGETLEEHCRRALRRGTTAGPHGLPLIGSCDWNDGLNRVGEQGVGESVWLAWFLHTVLHEWAALCVSEGRADEAAGLRHRAEELRREIERSAWDGAWYLRAWYDDGTPLGAAGNREAEIDLIAQAWAVLSGAGDPARAEQAMESAWRRLVRREDGTGEGMALLLAPPFDRAPGDPGYIKAYPPGVRENGGQYSHAAVWGAWAFAKLGDGARAVEILRMILPVDRTATPAGVERYRVEPYVVPADVYGVPPFTGRGGWTWYTGTAAWTYRLILEGILGLRREAGALVIDPCLPPNWPGYEAVIREGSAVYRVRVENPGAGRGVLAVTLDGELLEGARVPLRDDGREHEVVVTLGLEPDLRDEGEGLARLVEVVEG
jgi:cyclic beta-1,2-glucan synthetase